MDDIELNFQNLHINNTPYPNFHNDDNMYYRMDRKKRGIAVIFNQENFDDPQLKLREGTDKDKSDLENIFKNFGFEVEVYKDSTREQIEDNIDKISRYDYSDYDCFVMAVLTHGDKGILHAKNTFYKLNVLTTRFNSKNCPTLAGKPKIYFIQACRHRKCEAIPNSTVTEEMSTYAEFVTDPLELDQDFLIMFATLPGCYAFRNTETGSWFIQALCEQLRQYGHELDLVTILTFVIREVSN